MQKVQTIDESLRLGVSAFISYSRKDAGLAERLVSDLEAFGVNAYLDRRDIAPGEAWRHRLGELIAASDAVVFLVSPDSASSETCAWEVAQAHSLGKRLLPVVGRDPGRQAVPDLLSARNFIFCRTDDEYTIALPQLSAAIAQDIDVVREQTRLSQLAHGWASKSRSAAELLRGDALVAAERWRQVGQAQGIVLGAKLDEFICASRTTFDADEAARTRLVTSAFQAQSDYLAARSATLLAAGDPVSALCLAIESAPDRGSRHEENRTRPFTRRSLAALSGARRHLISFAFLPPDYRNLDALYAAPDGSALCGVRGAELMLFAGSAPFGVLERRDASSAVRDIAFSGDSKRLVALLSDRTAQVYEREGLEPKLTTEPWIEAFGVALNWSGSTLVLESAGALRTWSVSDGEGYCAQTTGHEPTAAGSLIAPFRYGSKIAPDATYAMVSIGGGDLRCLDWSPATGRWLALEGDRLSFRTFRNEVPSIWLVLPPESEAIQSRFSADGSTLVIAARQSGQCQWLIFDAADGHLISTISSGQPCEAGTRGPVFALSGNGAVLVSMSGVQLSRWDTRDGKLLQERRFLEPLNPWVEQPEFALRPSPDGDFVAVLLDQNAERRAYQVVVLQLQSAQLEVLDARSPFSAEGAYGCVWSDEARGWFALFGHSSKVVVVSTADTRRIRTVEHAFSRIDDGVRWAVFGPGGTTLLTCSCDLTARLWDVSSGVGLATYSHPSGVKRAAFSRDGAFVITLDDMATLRVFPVNGSEAIAEIVLQGAREIAVAANDVIVRTDRLLVLPGLLDAQRVVDECCSLLPRDLTRQERLQLDLPPDSPQCMLRYRKWPALLGESFAEVTSVRGALEAVRKATVEPARQAFRGILGRYGRGDIRQLGALGQFVWRHYCAAMAALCHKHGLDHNNDDFELAGDIFDALLEVAEEYRAPDLPVAMITAYRGPRPSGGFYEKWLAASQRRDG